MLPITESLTERATQSPKNTVLIDKTQVYSYADFEVKVDQITQALQSYGDLRGERVVFISHKTADNVALLFACWKIGAIAVPVNPILKATQFLHIVSDCAPALIVAEQSRLDDTQEALQFDQTKTITISTDASDQPETTPFICWSAFLNSADRPSILHRTPELGADAAILYTSGSTGNPKGVVLTNANIAYAASAVSQYLGNTPNDRILAAMPLSFDYGLSQITTTVHSGACVVLHNYFMPKGLIDAVTQYSITGIPAVPHVWEKLSRLDWPNVPKLRYVTNTGGSLRPATIKALQTQLPKVDIFAMYGFTEAFRATYLPPIMTDEKIGSIGKAVPHATVVIVDEAGNEVPDNTPGELIQCGPLVTRGYWNNFEATQKKFRTRYQNGDDETLYAWSGDIVTRDEDGYLYFVSRSDEQIKINGFRVNPTEIEQTLADCPNVETAAVLLNEDSYGTVSIRACIVLEKATAENERAISMWCKQNMPSYMVPSSFIFLDHLPTNPNNKIDKNRLASSYSDTPPLAPNV